jgi:hypothetical protein
MDGILEIEMGGWRSKVVGGVVVHAVAVAGPRGTSVPPPGYGR